MALPKDDPTDQNFEMAAGDTPALRIRITTDDGSDFDPTGADATWQLTAAEDSSGSSGVLVTKTISTGGAAFAVSAAGERFLVVPLLSADTLNIAPGVYRHRAVIMEAGGGRYHVLKGRARLRPGKL